MLVGWCVAFIAYHAGLLLLLVVVLMFMLPVLLLCLFAGVATAVILLLDIQPNISGGFTGKGGLATAF